MHVSYDNLKSWQNMTLHCTQNILSIYIPKKKKKTYPTKLPKLKSYLSLQLKIIKKLPVVACWWWEANRTEMAAP